MSIVPTNNASIPDTPSLPLPPELETCAQKIVEYLHDQGLKIGNPIDKGAQGVIFLLSDMKTGKNSYVLKITPPSKNSASFNFERGPHLVAKLKHPSLCIPTHYFYVNEGNKFSLTPTPDSKCIGTVMPYIRGERLRDKKFEIQQNAERIFHIGLLLAEAIQELSANKLEHCDLHDSNILIDENNEPNVIDFDLCAKGPLDEEEAPETPDHKHLRDHLLQLVILSPDINQKSKKFLTHCINKATPEQLLSPTFMQNCLDHLEEIQRKPTSRL